MGTHHDSPPCEMCDSTNTFSSFESRGGDYDVDCFDCGYGMKDSPRTETYEVTMITTRHCECGVGINYFTKVEQGYSYLCGSHQPNGCGKETVRLTMEMFPSVKPEDRWDMLLDEEDWQPCSNGCGDYWYDKSSDAERCCHNCLELLEVNQIWNDIELNL